MKLWDVDRERWEEEWRVLRMRDIAESPFQMQLVTQQTDPNARILRIIPINLQGIKAVTKQQLLDLYALTGYDIICLVETHHCVNSKFRKKAVVATTVRGLISEWTCIEIPCTCELTNTWCGAHGVAILARKGLTIVPEKIQLTGLGREDHRQLGALVTVDETVIAMVVCHFKSGNSRLAQLEKIIQADSAIQWLKSKTEAHMLLVVGDMNHDPWRYHWERLAKQFGNIDMKIESFLQLEGMREATKEPTWTHAHRGKPGAFLDHCAADSKNNLHVEVSLLTRDVVTITTDHPQLLQVDVCRGKPKRPDSLDNFTRHKYKCRTCGHGSNKRKIVHPFCLNNDVNVVVKYYKEHKKNMKKKLAKKQRDMKEGKVKTLACLCNGVRKPNILCRELCEVCALYYNGRYRAEHFLTHTQGKLAYCNPCHTTFKTMKDLLNHRKAGCRHDRKCGVCGIKCHAFNIRTHMFKHNKLSCDLCPARFSFMRDLVSHKLYHDRASIYECSVCKEHIPRKGAMEKHMAMSHPTHISSVSSKSCSSKEHVIQHKTVCGDNSSQKEQRSARYAKTLRNTVIQTPKSKEDIFVSSTTEAPSTHVDTCIMTVKTKSITRAAKSITRPAIEVFPKSNLSQEINVSLPRTTFTADINNLKQEINVSLPQARDFSDINTPSRPQVSQKIKERRFKCTMCEKNFEWATELRRHMVTHDMTRKRINCDICQKSFKSKESMHYHMKYHQQRYGVQYTCETCQKVFSGKSSYNSHKLVHVEPKYKCEYCHKPFRTAKTLQAHMRTHIKNVLNGVKGPVELHVQCEICREVFQKNCDLNQHRRCHGITEEQYQCPFCKHTYSAKEDLDLHIVNHENDGLGEEFQCKICSKQFTNSRTLTYHMADHPESYKFECPSCQRAFRTHHGLMQHVSIHRKISTPLRCDICNIDFRKNFAHKVHMRIHSAKDSFTCTLCSKVFSSKYNLKLHLISHSDLRPHKCSKCDKTFKYKGELVTHMKRHFQPEDIYKCQACKKIYKWKTTLRTHKCVP